MDFKTILETIKKPIQLEIKTGYQDKSAFGGLENYIAIWTKKAQEISLPTVQQKLVQRLSDVFAGYSQLSSLERMIRIQDALNIIKQIEGESEGGGQKAEKIEGERGREGEGATKAESFSPSHPLTPSPPQSFTPPSIDESELSYDVSLLESLLAPIKSVKGIGSKVAERLEAELGIKNVWDLLEHYPRDYIDRRKIKKIYQVGLSNEPETIQGEVVNQVDIPIKKANAPKLAKIIIYDGTATASLVGFGKRAGYLKISLPKKSRVLVSGKFERAYGEIQTTNFEYEVISDEEAELIHTGRIVPKYPLTVELADSNISNRSMRRWIKAALDQFSDSIPELIPHESLRRLNLSSRRTAIKQVHFPDSESYLLQARRKLSFDELFLLELGLCLRKKRWQTEERAKPFDSNGKLLKKFISSLPFELTKAQIRAFGQVKADLSKSHPMNRLLQGDVGSGKTIIAAMVLLIAVDNKHQGAIMAPTEILAEQHYHTLTNLLAPLDVTVVLLKGDMPKSEKDEAHEQIKDGRAQIVVGTHALIQETVEFDKLGLAITDEQHRFGVIQRAELKRKGLMPHVLVMTATPIPRTLALTLYGDLDISVLDELPPGRQKVETLRFYEYERDKMYAFIKKRILAGEQTYIVYPLVEESEKLEDIKAATEMAEHLQKEVFKEFNVGLLHGRMNAEQKSEIMTQFKEGSIHILVSTTVIEVGIDIPNATVMVIEHAERFGLSQLHQLRGRVGRSHLKSYCILVADPKNEDAMRRVDTMTQTNDGFKIAEEDLKIRGPGEFFGTRQAGMPDLNMADIIKDVRILELARSEAIKVVGEDPHLGKEAHQVMKAILKRKWTENFEIGLVG